MMKKAMVKFRKRLFIPELVFFLIRVIAIDP